MGDQERFSVSLGVADQMDSKLHGKIGGRALLLLQWHRLALLTEATPFVSLLSLLITQR